MSKPKGVTKEEFVAVMVALAERDPGAYLRLKLRALAMLAIESMSQSYRAN